MARPKLEDSELACLHEYGLIRRTRDVWLVGEQCLTNEDLGEPGVEHSMVSKFIKNLKLLELDSKDPITVHMKTCGGFLEEGMALYDVILRCPAHVTIINYTHARSMSSIILQAADHRAMMPDSCFMFHRGSLEVSGGVLQVRSNIRWDEKAEERMLDIYVQNMLLGATFGQQDPKKIRRMLIDQMNKKTDVFLTAREAVDWGLADEVLDG